MRSLIRVILPALALALAACNDTATDAGGTTGGDGGQDSGIPDSGGGGCTPACVSPQVCNTDAGQCACPSGAPPCGTMCCPNNYTCATNPTSCVCNLTYCGSDCINTINDPLNCGGCGKVCDGGVSCSNYACNYPIPDSGPVPDSGPPQPDSGPPVPDGGLPGLHKPCNPTASPDPCTPFGLFCNNQLATCELPIEYLTCLPAVGCATGFNCDTFTLQDMSQLSFCVTPCVDDRACTNLADTCISLQNKSVCFNVFCGPGSLPDGGDNGSDFYQPCVMVPTSRPGTCLPYPSSTGPFGICTESGTVAANQACSPVRVDGGSPDTFCDFNMQCIAFQVSDGDGGIIPAGSLCTPYCDTIGISSTEVCGAGSTCFAEGGDFGFCLQDCDITAPVCPPELQCGPFNTPPTGQCLPVPDAG